MLLATIVEDSVHIWMDKFLLMEFFPRTSLCESYKNLPNYRFYRSRYQEIHLLMPYSLLHKKVFFLDLEIKNIHYFVPVHMMG
ncbi:hypothetical protein DW259_03355 [[Ruminococcus] torques]|nr:hypothetical protein DW259_03355 [[Ruminococcus] torques]